MTTTVLFSTFPPFPTLSLSIPSTTTISSIPALLRDRYPSIPLPPDLIISSHSRLLPPVTSPISVLHDLSSPLVSLRLTPHVLGGKGGFGSQLRAAGGRMSSQKTSNNDSCRDLSGRRLSTIKEAKKLAEYLENEPARKKAAAEASKAKLEALEKKLGISPPDATGASSSNSNSKADGPAAGKKHRFDDTEYFEQSREIVDNVKSAVSAGLLKKKKAKTSHPAPVDSTTSAGAEKLFESPPTVAPVASVQG